MGSIVWRLGDGTLFFAGLGLVAAGLPLLVALGASGIARIACASAVVAGAGLAIVSSAPQPVWLLTVWIVVAAVALVALLLGIRSEKLRRPHRCLLALVEALSLGIAISEFSYRSLPAIHPCDRAVFVIGDSLSAGIGSRERLWPDILADLTGLSVVNLARAGANADSALAQARRIPQVPAIVLVEIGGNDLLGRTAPAKFDRHLDALLAEIRGKGADVFLFELPLPPFQDDYGRAQRRLSRQHGAALIPKTVLACVLGMEGATTDGIHLSPKGHEALARAVAAMVVPAAARAVSISPPSPFSAM
jgi:acyl-CoA thioesterase I